MRSVQVHPARPLWTDRQWIAAADLTAEQTLQDARLARLRRFALGWGVVAGFEISIQGASLVISPGYGISPLGAEIYLAEELVWSGILTDLTNACAGGQTTDCDNPAALREVPVDDSILDAWIVVRPDTLLSCPRPQVPAGCAPAGGDWAYSRQSGALQFAVVCGLQAGLLPDFVDCDAVQALLRDGQVTLPPDLPDMLPLAQVSFSRSSLAEVSMVNRRRLLPMSLMQAALACCDCAPEVADPVDDAGNDLPQNDTVADDVWDAPFDYLLQDLVDEFDGFFPGRTKDMNRQLQDIFGPDPAPELFVRVGPDDTGGAFDRPLLQAFAAAAMVTNAAGLRSWLDGNHDQIYQEAVNRNSAGARFDLGAMTIAQLAEQTRNIRLMQAAFGTIPVADIGAVPLETLVQNKGQPGGRAMLGFVQMRLAQLFQL